MIFGLIIWTLTIDADEVTTTIHSSEARALETLRAFFDDSDGDVPQEDGELVDWATTTGGICFWLEEHQIKVSDEIQWVPA